MFFPLWPCFLPVGLNPEKKSPDRKEFDPGISLVSARSYYNNRLSSTVVIFLPGRSSDFPSLPAAFPFLLYGTVAYDGQKSFPYGKGSQRRVRLRFPRSSLIIDHWTIIVLTDTWNNRIQNIVPTHCCQVSCTIYCGQPRKLYNIQGEASTKKKAPAIGKVWWTL